MLWTNGNQSVDEAETAEACELQLLIGASLQHTDSSTEMMACFGDYRASMMA